MDESSGTLVDSLRNSGHYREFLRIWFESQGVRYAAFARKAGFSSRSFPRDVVTGKRRLSAKAFVKFQGALELPPRWRKFFRLLVAQSEPDLFGRKSGSRARAELEMLRGTLGAARERKNLVRATDDSDRILSIPKVLPILAALGDAEQGATLQQIRARTSQDERMLRASLGEMMKVGLARANEDSSRYYPLSFHVSLSQAGKSRVFRGLYERALEASRRRSHVAFDSDSELFFTSAFCVSEAQLPRLKSELREVLLRYVDDSSETCGDQVVTLVTGLNRG